MICSFLIPSRKHSSGLERAIRSVGNLEDVEFIVRADDDDRDTIKTCEHLAIEFSNLRHVVGKRGQGYGSVAYFVDELYRIAKGQWISMLDDDVTLEGETWLKQLTAMPLSGVYVRTEFYFLGPSRYGPSCRGPAGWFAPKDTWPGPFSGAVDVRMEHELSVNRKWKSAYLQGIAYNHHWIENRGRN